MISVTPLASRLFGVWNLTSGALRVVCAYNMSNAACVLPGYMRLHASEGSRYPLSPSRLFFTCQMTFAIVLLHLLLEIFIYKTTSLSAPGVLSPILVASQLSAILIATFFFADF